LSCVTAPPNPPPYPHPPSASRTLLLSSWIYDFSTNLGRHGRQEVSFHKVPLIIAHSLNESSVPCKRDRECPDISGRKRMFVCPSAALTQQQLQQGLGWVQPSTPPIPTTASELGASQPACSLGSGLFLGRWLASEVSPDSQHGTQGPLKSAHLKAPDGHSPRSL
jgi:hypothetical protein